MTKEQVIGSYLVRFTEKERHRQVTLQNLKTGERLEFETWIAAWVFLENQLAPDALAPDALAPDALAPDAPGALPRAPPPDNPEDPEV